MWIPCRVLLLCCLLLPFALSPAIAAEILSVTQDPDEPPRYDIIEISIEVDSTYENPCDPEEVRLWAEMESPAGEVVTAGGFWYEPHSRALDGGTEVFTPAGPLDDPLRPPARGPLRLPHTCRG